MDQVEPVYVHRFSNDHYNSEVTKYMHYYSEFSES